MSRDIDSILTSARKQGIRLDEREGALLVDAPQGALTDSFKSILAENKEALLARLAPRQGLPALEPQPVQPHYPLSRGQLRMWAMCQDASRSQAYNMSAMFEAKGPLDIDALENAFRHVIGRHESLRTRFDLVEGEPRQFVDAAIQLCIEKRTAGSRDNGLIEAEAFVSTPFDLASGPLVRLAVFSFADACSIIAFAAHHVVCDGWSMEILTKEVMAAYQSYRNGSSTNLSDPKIQYRDFVAWEHEVLTGNRLDDASRYWKEMLSGDLERLELPKDRERPAVSRFNGAKLRRCLDSELSEELNSLSLDNGLSPFSLLAAVANALFYRYTGHEDIVVGVPASGRHLPELRDQIGLFVNTLPIRSRISEELSFLELAKGIHANLQKGQEHQGYPFDAMLEDVGYRADAARNPLFDVMLVMDEVWAKPDLPGIDLSRVEGNTVSPKFDFLIHFHKGEKGLELKVEYSTDLFDSDHIERMLGHFEVLLASAVADPDSLIRDLDILPSWEREKFLVEFNDTEVEYPKDKLVHEFFEEQARKHPDRVALVMSNSCDSARHAEQKGRRKLVEGSWVSREMTYGELDARSNALAWTLREEHGVKPDVLVPMLVERSFEMVVGILGILKAGGAYVPIDPKYPYTRIRFMLEDCSARTVLLNVDGMAESLPEGCENLDLRDNRDYSLDTSPLPRVTSPSDLVYCIYTSGSTGKPKGALLEHAGLVNRLLWMRDYLPLNESDTILQKTSYTFDVSAWELLLPGLIGARMLLLEPGEERDPSSIRAVIAKWNVTTLHFVPSMLSAYLDAAGENPLPSVKRCVCSGEALSSDLAHRFHKACVGRVELHNLYGPTEASIDVTACEVTEVEGPVPIGFPVANTRIRILDKMGSLCPVGVPGELCVSGVQVARGYLNRPALTAERFVSDPFRPGERMYRTGDLARWLPDGNLEFLGRMDDQVKVRGFRVELGEVESALVSEEPIRGAVVAVRNDSLVAYCVADSGEALDFASLRSSLSSRLPGYMVPSFFMELESLPLTPSGKLDRKSLPEPVGSTLNNGHVAPQCGIEKTLSLIYQRVLKTQGINALSGFLSSGGNSLQLLHLANEIRAEFGVSVAVGDLYRHQTPREIAHLLKTRPAIEKGTSEVQKEIMPKGSVETCLPASFNQNLALYLHMKEELTHQEWNTNYLFKVKFPFCNGKAIEVINQIVEGDDIFRTRFILCDGSLYQSIGDRPQVAIQIVDQEKSGKTFSEIKSLVYNNSKIKFSLDSPPLFKVFFYLRDTNKDSSFYCHLVCSHLVCDPRSLNMIASLFCSLYKRSLNDENMLDRLPKRLQYREYSEWYWRQKRTSNFESDRSFWRRFLSLESPEAIRRQSGPVDEMLQKPVSMHRFILEPAYCGIIDKLIGSKGNSLGGVIVSLLSRAIKRSVDMSIQSIILNNWMAPKPEFSATFGCFHSYLALPVANVLRQGLSETAAGFSCNIFEALSHPLFDFFDILTELGIDFKREGLPFLLYEVNIAPDETLPFSGSDKATKPARLTPAAGPVPNLRNLTNFVFRVTGDKAGLAITMEYHADFSTLDLVEKIDLSIRQDLDSLACDVEDVHQLRE